MAIHTTAILLPTPHAAPWHPANTFRAARTTIADNAVAEAKATADAPALPMPNALVRLHSKRTGALHWQGLSGPDGRYHATDLIPGANYIPVALDPSGQFEAVAAGPVRAKLVPGLAAPAIAAIIGRPWAAPIFAEGASPAHVITHTSGALPAGVSYSPVAGFFGTPSGDSGDYPLVMTITDANGTVDATLVLRNVLLPLEIIGDMSYRLKTDEPMEPVVFRARGGEGPYTFDVVGDLPSGLSLTDNGDGTATLSGTPDEYGAFDFSVRATDVRSKQALVQLAGNIVSGDLYWDKVVALLHFDDPNNVVKTEKGATWYIHNVNSGFGEVTQDAAKLGMAGLNLNSPGGSNYYFPAANGIILTGEIFTAEVFCMPRKLSSFIFTSFFGAGDSDQIVSFNNGGKISFYRGNNAPGGALNSVGVNQYAINTYYHIAMTFDGTHIRVFVDGNKEIEIATAVGWTGQSGTRFGLGDLDIGNYNSPYRQATNVYFDELRITKEVARYTDDFDPPTAPFPDF